MESSQAQLRANRLPFQEEPERNLERFEELPVYTEKEYQELNKKLVIFKEETFEKLQSYGVLIKLFEEEVSNKKALESQLKITQDKMHELKTELVNTQAENKKIKRELNALKNSKLGKLTKKYWSLRKRLHKGANKS